MRQERFLSSENLGRLVTTLVEGGTRVFGPSSMNGRREYRAIARAEQLELAGPLPATPLKALFLPPSEALFTWRQRHNEVELTAVPTTFTPAVVIGARPCDVAGVEVLDKVMGWDYRDELWFGRRDATTIVALACETKGHDCFCERVGLGPESPKGSDILLETVPGGYRAVVLTTKGDALVEKAGTLFTAVEASQAKPAEIQSDAAARLEATRQWLAGHFEDPVWTGIALRCHGCGACASVCPTCHCFDIVDEPDGLLGGTRRRNWDACQSSKFTVHASGHNPRGDQNVRFRQRVLHKFSIYPERFGETLCTGCGRCAQACAAGQNLPDILDQIERAAGVTTGNRP